LADQIDVFIRSGGYRSGVEAALRRREERHDPPPNYFGLMVVSRDGPRLTASAIQSGRALRLIAGEGRVHVVSTQALVRSERIVEVEARLEKPI
jgi:hypothetical protein